MDSKFHFALFGFDAVSTVDEIDAFFLYLQATDT